MNSYHLNAIKKSMNAQPSQSQAQLASNAAVGPIKFHAASVDKLTTNPMVKGGWSRYETP